MNNNKTNKDIFGRAISAFYYRRDKTNITVHSPDFDDDIIPVSYFFRNYSEMPDLEKRALNRSRGKVLDVGCGAGSHSLYLQEEKKLVVSSLDSSQGAVEVCKRRGLKDVRKIDFFNLENERFDTILMLMNGSGIIGKMKNLGPFFQHIKKLLSPGGQVLMDSSDLRYFLDPKDNDSTVVNPEEKYCGEILFEIGYVDGISEPFPWLYIDFDSLKTAADKENCECTLVEQGKNHDYLAKLSFKSS